MKAFWTLIVIILLIFTIGAAYMFFGLYDISASRKEAAVQRWILSSIMVSSIKHYAKESSMPDLEDSSLIATGFEHFKEMCITCHGAPGEYRSEIGRGLNPEAPDLVRTTGKWSDAELFWILKNGIKMTGMPAFGITHSDDKIWAMVAFVRHLQKMTPEEYQNYSKAHSDNQESKISD
jgi:mono/diheme cytochrome c family protein